MVNCFIKAGQTPDITEPYYCQYSSLYFLEPEIQIQKSSPILLVMREDTIQSRMQALRLFGIRYLLHKRAREYGLNCYYLLQNVILTYLYGSPPSRPYTYIQYLSL